jgi:hypothetical protein
LAIAFDLHEELTDGLAAVGLRRVDLMDGVSAHDPRVGAILKTPDEYFARARRKAWLGAWEDVAADLARRAQQRQNGRLSEPAKWTPRGSAAPRH